VLITIVCVEKNKFLFEEYVKKLDEKSDEELTIKYYFIDEEQTTLEDVVFELSSRTENEPDIALFDDYTDSLYDPTLITRRFLSFSRLLLSNSCIESNGLRSREIYSVWLYSLFIRQS